jgi:hypothetical protein
LVPENERAALIQSYMNTQRAERERERAERERERAERERELSLVPDSQKAALLLARQTVLLAREKTKQMKIERGSSTSKSREGTSYSTIFIITNY